jgi:hypothetical protein
MEIWERPVFSCHCGYHLLFGLCVFLLYFLATEMHPHQPCYIKTYETLKKHKMKMDVVCVADSLLKLGVLPCSCHELQHNLYINSPKTKFGQWISLQ